MAAQFVGLNSPDFFNIRVIQKNLVYVIGIPQKYADDSVLRRQEFFGQFGSIKKIIINKRSTSLESFKLPEYRSNDTKLAGSEVSYKSIESTASAYITFSTEFEAKWCIQEVDESILDNKVIRCTYGTTKYCSFYLKNIPCQNNECMYLHECRHSKDILTKDELINTKHKLHDFESRNKNVERIGKKKRFDFLDDIFQFKTQTNFKAPRKILFEPIDFSKF